MKDLPTRMLAGISLIAIDYCRALKASLTALSAAAMQATQARYRATARAVPMMERTKPAVATPEGAFFLATAPRMIPTIPTIAAIRGKSETEQQQ